MQSFRNAVSRAIEAYNHYRSPEATAKIVKIEKDKLIIDFEGSFCKTCGVYDYLEDFIYELQAVINAKMKILKFESIEPEKIRVEYAVKHSVNEHE